MYVNKLRTIHDSRAVSCEDYVYGFSVTYIVTYEDGRKERVQYLDKSVDRDLAETSTKAKVEATE